MDLVPCGWCTDFKALLVSYSYFLLHSNVKAGIGFLVGGVPDLIALVMSYFYCLLHSVVQNLCFSKERKLQKLQL